MERTKENAAKVFRLVFGEEPQNVGATMFGSPIAFGGSKSVTIWLAHVECAFGNVQHAARIDGNTPETIAARLREKLGLPSSATAAEAPTSIVDRRAAIQRRIDAAWHRVENASAMSRGCMLDQYSAACAELAALDAPTPTTIELDTPHPAVAAIERVNAWIDAERDAIRKRRAQLDVRRREIEYDRNILSARLDACQAIADLIAEDDQ